MKRYELRFGLLGPPVLFDAGTAQVLGSPKARALLAALLLEGGRTVSVESLKDALWGGAPPASAQASLHNHVTRLRRLLDDPERLRAVPPGYLLRVEQGELDVHVFDTHVAEARAAHAGRDWAGTVRACTDALALWRGSPLSGLPAELGGYAFAQRLREARLLLLELRYDAELAVGDRLDALVLELMSLTAEHPLREAFHRQLMLALHRTGRQAEALAVHRDLRTRLLDELGVEPGAGVREAHVEVLREATETSTGTEGTRADPRAANTAPGVVDEAPAPGTADATLAPTDAVLQAAGVEGEALGVNGDPADPDPGTAAAEPRTVAAPSPPRPAQLPPPPPHFTGRAAVLDDVRRTLSDAEPATVAVISGMAGVGKSALALHVAHGLRERFPDGQLYVNLHGATPGMTPLTSSQALTALLRDLGTDPRSIPEHPDAAAALLRSMLAPTRTLMVLDDAGTAAQVRPLLPAGTGCGVIVTSRSPLTTLDGARRFALAPLSAEDSAALLRTVSGREGGGGDGGGAGDAADGDRIDASHPLVELTGRLPLALRIVAARLAARRALTPDVLADQLAATEDRLRHLEYDDLSVRRSLAVAHDALAASGRRTDRDAALALRRLGALDLPTYGAPLIARLLGTETSRAEAALDRLVDVALLDETAYGRYTPHDLVRDFARELATPAGAPDIARTAVRWYTGVAERALTAIVEPGLDQDDRRRPTAAQPPEHAAHVLSVPAFASAEEAFAWGTSELENVIALVERYADAPDERTAAHVSTLLRLFFPYLQRSGRVSEMEGLGQAAVRLARRLGDEAAEAYALLDLAGLHFLTGRPGEALTLVDESLVLWRRLGALARIRRGLGNRGLLLETLGRYEESAEALRQSLELSRQLDDPWGEAVTYGHLGNLYEHTDPRAAIEQHRRSLAIGVEIGNVIVQHSAHCNIGYAHLTLGEPAAALPHFEESRRILGGHGDWHGESQTRLGLVRALRLLGRTEQAESECVELLSRADARADGYAGGLARHQHGLLLQELGRTEEAYDQWRTALAALDGTDRKEVVAELRALLDD
ncbi:BTAD domain-containing putative transcriptional regulator [Streptomyces sp. RG80]|uniref:AfsR/SARP family transcriptional regulator n=1 Tax=Streptomyces sp. RG80 TaxID=3157340 RepID=UPI00338D70DD